MNSKLKDIVLVGHGALGEGALFINADKQKRHAKLADKGPNDIPCRVLCLIGKRDLPRFHAVAEYLSKTIPELSVVVVPKAGHMANMENPNFVIGRINDFLGQ